MIHVSGTVMASTEQAIWRFDATIFPCNSLVRSHGTRKVSDGATERKSVMNMRCAFASRHVNGKVMLTFRSRL